MKTLYVNQKGIVLLYAAVIGSIILLVGLSIIALVAAEIRFAGRIDDSVRAFYAAESGVEYAARWITDGGVIDSTKPTALYPLGLCRDPKTSLMESSFNSAAAGLTSDQANAFNWSNLIIYRINKTDSSFLRIKVDGSSNGAVRTVVFDLTPRCNFSLFIPTSGDLDPDSTTEVRQVYP